jgi:erythromycin esterase
MKRAVSSILLVLATASYGQQNVQNLDFEVLDEETSAPLKWYVVEESGARYTLDISSYSGEKSLLLWPQTLQTPFSATLLHGLESAHFKGKKKVRITGRVKCIDPDCEVSVIVKQLSAAGQELLNSNTHTYRRSFRKNVWDTLSIERPIDPAAEYFAFGLKVSDNDSIWIDAFEVYLDGIRLPDAKPQAARMPARRDLRWIEKQGCLSFDPANRNSLKSIRGSLENERLVGLGEVTHGSSEVYQAKTRIVQLMVAELGFDMLAMEMDVAEAESLNSFLVSGEGDARTLLSNVGYWPWRTEEFLCLLNWMRGFNMTNARKIQLKGIDVSEPQRLISSMLQFADRYDQELGQKLAPLSSANWEAPSADEGSLLHVVQKIDSIVNYWGARKKHLIEISGLSQVLDMEYKLENLKQMALHRAKSRENNSMLRDEFMARNASLLIQQNPQSKIVIWAHNAHISKGDYGHGMGGMLAKKYSLFSIGFALGSGQFNAITGSGGGIVTMNLTPPVTDSYEFFLSKSKCPMTYVDLRLQKRNSGNEWLFAQHKLRYVGAAVVLKYQFVSIDLISNFDGIVFINESNPSRLLK